MNHAIRLALMALGALTAACWAALFALGWLSTRGLPDTCPDCEELDESVIQRKPFRSLRQIMVDDGRWFGSADPAYADLPEADIHLVNTILGRTN